MAIDIPVPKIVADVEAGGPLVTAMRGMNALSQQNLDTHMKRLENKYYPQKTMAETASKLAYANLMGPQFLSKLMQSDPVLANMSDKQKSQMLNMITSAGMGQANANQMLVNPSGEQNVPQQSFKPSAMQQPPMQQAQMQQPAMGGNAQRGYDEQLTPEQQKQINEIAPGNTYIPELNAMASQRNTPQQQPSESQPTFAENVGTYKGVVEEGKKAGQIRAQDIKDLNDTYFGLQTNQATLDDVSNILGSPEFEQIRQTPLLGHHELSYYSKFGTPAQQDMVGQYYTLTGNIIKDSARDFAGAFRKGEQQLLTGMKPNPGDTVNAARGKVEALSVMNKLLSERTRLTSEIMNKYHVNKLQATEMADKQVNGNEIRKQIHNKLNPTVTIKNRKTGEQRTISISEARKLGVPNV